MATCGECGSVDYHTGYLNGNIKKTMNKEGVCFSCAFWINQNKRKNQVIIEGSMYAVGSGGEGGMSGRKFDIKFKDGRQVTTNDLWHQGTIPEHFRARMPDNAKFEGGAEKCEAGETTCFNPSK